MKLRLTPRRKQVRSHFYRPRLDILEDRRLPATFTVTNTLDSGDGSLRQAILDANFSAEADRIEFRIEGGGLQIINLLSPLPTITSSVDIDGRTQQGFEGKPLIVLNGAGAGAGANGLVFTANNNALHRLVIQAFGGDGIRLIGARSSVLIGNYIGTDVTGTQDVGNGGNGVLLDGAGNNTIGATVRSAANVISGNNGNGILLTNGADDNEISGNFIGTDITGASALGNSLDGVQAINSDRNLIGHSNPVIGIDYFDADAVSPTATGWQGIRNADTAGQYLISGTSGSTGLLFEGAITGVGTTYAVAFPKALAPNVVATSVYGPDNLDGNRIRLVGTYRNDEALQSDVTVNGFLFEGTTADLPSGGNYRTVNFPGAQFNYVHSTMGGLAVGNYDSLTDHGKDGLPLGPGHAFLYGIARSEFLADIVFPNSKSNTAYGIWFNGKNAQGNPFYTIAGGYSLDPVNNLENPDRPIGLGYLVDYDSVTGQFSHWKSFEYPNGINFVTHFEGISSVEQGVYTLSADSVQVGTADPGQGSWVTVRRNTDDSFGDGVWVDLNYKDLDPRTHITSSNSVYGNQVVGIVFGPNSPGAFQATVNIGFQLSNVISGNAGNGVGLSGANDNDIAMNYIGTDSSGTLDRGNAGNGILLTEAPARNRIGGEATGGNNPTAGVIVRPPQGNLISGNNLNGVLINGMAANNVLAGNFIGTKASGTSALANELDGVAIDQANGNQLLGTTYQQRPFVFYNVISGNGGNGVRVTNANDTVMQANFLGLGADNATGVPNALDGQLIEGTSARTEFGGVIPLGNVSAANQLNGVEIRDSASGVIVYNCFCGLAAFSDAPQLGNGRDGVLVTSTGPGIILITNVLAGNAGDGVEISGNARGVQVTEAIVGLNTFGFTTRPNGGSGIVLAGNASNNTIGGFQPSIIPQNIISANRGNGVTIRDNASGNQVINSFIGTNVNGDRALGNDGDGIFIGGSARGNTIGGTAMRLRNLISGNSGDGIEIADSSRDNVVQSNFIGTNVDNNADLGNSGNGILVRAANNLIGGTQAGAGNVIAFSRLDGVRVSTGVGNGILSNSIHGNRGLGIRLVDNGNDNQPAPVLTSAELAGSVVVVSGVLQASSNSTFRIEIFNNPRATQRLTGQGRVFLGFVTVTTNSIGQGSFAIALSGSVPAGSTITATATAADNDTSQFSSDVRVVQPLLVTGAGPGGGPDVLAFNPVTQVLLFNIFAFNPLFTGGVRVASGDMNDDGFADVIAAAGPGGGPHVRVFDGVTAQPLTSPIGSFFAFNPLFTGGVYVAVADMNGDGFLDVIAGAGQGGGPNVAVYSGQDGSLLASWFAYDVLFTGGVSVAAGDIDGNGAADIITGAGPGGGPHVRAFNIAGQQLNSILGSFFAYNPAFTGGVFVAAGDVNGDGIADVITGAGAGGGPDVLVFNGATGSVLANFFPFDALFTGGVRVGTTYANGDGLADLLLGAGPGGGPQLRIFDSATLEPIDSFFAYDPAFTGGIFVGG